MGLLNPGGPIAQFKRNRCSISPVEVILLSGVRIQPAWDALGEDEKTVLTIFFLSENGKTDAIEEISERFCVERSSAYKKKDRALAHLALLLYGR